MTQSMNPAHAAQGGWQRYALVFGAMAALLLGVGTLQSWSVMLAIVNLCLISAIMALGVNIQWGYAGLFNAGIMGFAALGGLAAVLVSESPIMPSARMNRPGSKAPLSNAAWIMALPP